VVDRCSVTHFPPSSQANRSAQIDITLPAARTPIHNIHRKRPPRKRPDQVCCGQEYDPGSHPTNSSLHMDLPDSLPCVLVAAQSMN
jgi:hypothetical protein